MPSRCLPCSHYYRGDEDGRDDDDDAISSFLPAKDLRNRWPARVLNMGYISST